MSMRYGPVDLSVPPGFQNILHLISQEVLRIKPSNAHEFIAGFLDDLIAIREESGYDPVTQGEMIERVQERYWKVERERQNSRMDGKVADQKSTSNTPELRDGSGDVHVGQIDDHGDETESAEIHKDGADIMDEDMDHIDQVARQQEEVAEQPAPQLEEEEGEDEVEGTTQGAGVVNEGMPEGEDEAVVEVTTATEDPDADGQPMEDEAGEGKDAGEEEAVTKEEN